MNAVDGTWAAADDPWGGYLTVSCDLVLFTTCSFFVSDYTSVAQDKGLESVGGGKNAFIGNHGTTWVPVDWNVSNPIEQWL